jgi:hypothetical protein
VTDLDDPCPTAPELRPDRLTGRASAYRVASRAFAASGGIVGAGAALLRPDAAVKLLLLTRLVSFVSTPITLILVATRFSPVTQGFYYTFTQITQFTILLELGLGMVLTQFASQEFAHLHWTPAGSLAGSDSPLRHLLGILVKACRWYVAVALVAVVTFIPAGLAFFASQGHAHGVDYARPWVILVALTAAGMLAVPISAVIEGCGRVLDVTRLRFVQAITSSVLLWAGILGHQALYCAAAAAIGPVIVPAVWFVRRYRGLLGQLRRGLRSQADARVSWRTELLPMQWRIAVSWIAGFLVFALFTPLLFRYQGAAVAGRMGMSLTVANVPFVLGMSWLMTRTPGYGTLIRQRSWRELDATALTGTLQAVVVWAAASVSLLVGVKAADIWLPSFGQRVLGVGTLAALCLGSLVNVLMQAMAGYLRAHKQEPYVAISVGTGLLVAAASWITARFGTPGAMAIAYAAVTGLVELPVAVAIFMRKRREWHAGAEKT